MVAMVLLALSPRLQPGEHCLHYSHGGHGSIHSERILLHAEIVRRVRLEIFYGERLLSEDPTGRFTP